MLATHPVGYLRFLISIAALGLLAALLLLPAPVRAQTPDMTPPTLLAANVDGTSLKLIYSEALKMDSVPAASAYSVVVASATGVAPSSVAVSGAKVTLTLSTGAANGNTVTVTYVVPTTGNKLQDLANPGNDAAALTTHAVANYTDTTNHLPVFPTAADSPAPWRRTRPTATQFGTAVTATDADSSETLYYTLPSSFSVFTIGMNTGHLLTSLDLDYESSTTSYVVPVYVSDKKDADGGTDDVIDDTILVTINVTNVNEAPVLAAGGNSITRPENTSTSTVLHTFMASDEDAGTTFQWSYSGVDATDAAPFRITSNYDVTELTFRNTLDYEMPTDGNMDNVYEIEVRVSDGSAEPSRESSPSPSRTSTSRPPSTLGTRPRSASRRIPPRQRTSGARTPLPT